VEWRNHSNNIQRGLNIVEDDERLSLVQQAMRLLGKSRLVLHRRWTSLRIETGERITECDSWIRDARTRNNSDSPREAGFLIELTYRDCCDRGFP
jgi:hypothetical protein